TMVRQALQLLVIGTALRGAGREVNFRTEPMQKYALPTLCLLALACDAFPKFQLQLQSEIQREFHITNAMVMVVDTKYMLGAFTVEPPALEDCSKLTSKRWLVGLSALVVMLTIAGAVSFVRYAQRHRANPWLAAVAPFDIYVPGLEAWRVRLAEELTAQLDSM